MKDTLVIAAFPATGKSYMFENYNNDYTILDSDSSKFSWTERKRTDEELEEMRIRYESERHLLSWNGYYNKIKNDLIKTRNPEFPNNYIQHIKENIGKVDFIFVSTHKQVLKAMEEAGIEFFIVYPERHLMHEYIGRCYCRPNNGFPIDVLIQNWNNWMDDMEEFSKHHVYFTLNYGEHISDYINSLIDIKRLLSISCKEE